MAKKRRRRRAPEGVDPNEKRRQRLEARRQAKAEALARQRRAQSRERLVRYVLIAGLAGFTIWFLFLRGGTPSEFRGHAVQDLSLAGAGEHSDTPQQYDSNPPVSGVHDPNPADCGVYSTDIPDGNEVHTLEHGAVGILYKPALASDQIEQIESIVQSFDSHTFSAPDNDMDPPIVVTAWGHMMEMNTVDEPAIRDFIEEFRKGGDAPESFQPCDNVQDDPFVDTQATPTPAESESPEDKDKADRGDKGDKDDGKDDKKGKN